MDNMKIPAPRRLKIEVLGECSKHSAIGIEAKNSYVVEDDAVLILLSGGRIAVVDRSDFALVAPLRWSHDGNGYAQCSVRCDGRMEHPRLHRFLLGREADGWFVDHINGCRADCRRANLRLCSSRENVLNRARNVANTIGYKGVRQHKLGYFFVQIKQFGKCHRTGQYDTAEEAARAYDFVAKKWFGAFARLNFPEDEPNGGTAGKAFPYGANVQPTSIRALVRLLAL